MSIRKITILALFMALQVVLDLAYVPVTESLRITFSFIIMMIVGISFDLKTCLLYGVVEDLVSFMIFPSGSFFPGYTLSAAFSMAIYNLCLYQKPTIKNIIISRVLACGLNYVILHSIWNTMMFSKGFIFYVTKSLAKNIIMCPIEIIIFIAVFKVIEPLLVNSDLLKKSS